MANPVHYRQPRHPVDSKTPGSRVIMGYCELRMASKYRPPGTMKSSKIQIPTIFSGGKVKEITKMANPIIPLDKDRTHPVPSKEPRSTTLGTLQDHGHKQVQVLIQKAYIPEMGIKL